MVLASHVALPFPTLHTQVQCSKLTTIMYGWVQAASGTYKPICPFNQEHACEQLLAFWPDVIGGVLFVTGSWFFWWAAHETPWLAVKRQKLGTVEWFLTLFNIVGSVGFFYGAASQAALVRVHGLVANWVQLLLGYVFGSAFFLLGSYLMIAEVASNVE